MARNFNRGMPGLLGYIDQKSDGRNPAFLAETTQAVLQLDPWLRSQAEYVTLAPVSAALGGLILCGDICPVAESWLLFDCSFTVTVSGPAQAAGNNTIVQLLQVNSAANQGVPISPPDRYQYVTASPPHQVMAASAYAPGPFILRPGEQLGARADGQNAGGSTSTMFWRYRRLTFSA